MARSTALLQPRKIPGAAGTNLAGKAIRSTEAHAVTLSQCQTVQVALTDCRWARASYVRRACSQVSLKPGMEPQAGRHT